MGEDPPSVFMSEEEEQEAYGSKEGIDTMRYEYKFRLVYYKEYKQKQYEFVYHRPKHQSVTAGYTYIFHLFLTKLRNLGESQAASPRRSFSRVKSQIFLRMNLKASLSWDFTI